MAIESRYIPDVPPLLARYRQLHPTSARVSIIRHGEKTDASGPLTDQGWIAAETEGVEIGESAADSGVHRIVVQAGQVPRTQQTAEAVAQGVRHGYIRRHREVPLSPIVEVTDPRPELSLSAIADSPESVFVQQYLMRLRGVRAVVENSHGLIRTLMRRGRDHLEQAVAGELLLEWLRLDDERMKLPSGEPDPHTRSAREVARTQAYFLRQDLNEIIESYKEGKQVEILKYSHENMVLIWARYFLYQNLKGRRRGQPDRTIRGMEIVEKIGGKIEYLGGVHIHLFDEGENGIKLRARFNNAWYEVDMDAINTLADEAEQLLGPTEDVA